MIGNSTGFWQFHRSKEGSVTPFKDEQGTVGWSRLTIYYYPKNLDIKDFSNNYHFKCQKRKWGEQKETYQNYNLTTTNPPISSLFAVAQHLCVGRFRLHSQPMARPEACYLHIGLENMVWGISIVSRSAGSRFSRLIPFFEIANSCASSRFLFRSNPDLTFPPFSRFETIKLSYVRSKFHSLRPQNGRNSWESETLNPKASTWQSGYSADQRQGEKNENQKKRK